MTTTPSPPATPASHTIKAALQAGLGHHQSGQLDEAKHFYH